MGDNPRRMVPVIRRVGGLEDSGVEFAPVHIVIRRVGGLEDSRSLGNWPSQVIRRVGGLEG